MTKEPLSSKFRPMLAGSIKQNSDLEKLNYPMIASPKIDGIRALVHPTKGLVTRSLKPVPNKHTHKYFQALLEAIPMMSGMDGELIAGKQHNWVDDTIFNQTTRAVMSHQGEPQLVYWVFDSFFVPEAPYNERFGIIKTHVLPEIEYVQSQELRYEIDPIVLFLALENKLCMQAADILSYEKRCLDRGFEGIMLRDPKRPYKFGRSAITKTQQHLIKLKRFEGDFIDDAEAEIVGFEELMHNNNPKIADNFGLTKRSSHKAGKVGGNTLGKFKVRAINGRFAGVEFKIGSGLTQQLRKTIWENREDFIGKILTYKYQAYGSLHKPRIPIFKGFRGDE